MYILSEITIYPIKSLAGIALPNAKITERGLLHDRRFMLINSEGEFQTQRRFHEMALLRTILRKSGIEVFHAKNPDNRLLVSFDEIGNQTCEVTIWDDVVTASLVNNTADKWFSDVLQTDLRLVYMSDNSHRKVDGKYATNPADIVSFADGYPFLIIGEASLQELNKRLVLPVSMNRFRTNFVLSGGSPFDEDTFDEIRIGSAHFKVVKPCARCIMTTISQETAQSMAEPLHTLSSFRKTNNKVLFGQNLIALQHGTVHLGDTIEIVKYKHKEHPV